MKKIIIYYFMAFIICVLTRCNTTKKYDVTFKIANNINDDIIIFKPEDKEKEYTIEYCDKEIYFYSDGYILNDHPTLDDVWHNNIDFLN